MIDDLLDVLLHFLLSIMALALTVWLVVYICQAFGIIPTTPCQSGGYLIGGVVVN